MFQHYDPHNLLEATKQALTQLGLRFGEAGDRPALHLTSRGKNGVFPCFLQVHPSQPLIIVYAHVQCAIPAEKRSAVAEFVTRANYGIWLGNFEMDLRDGELRYKTSVHVADGQLTSEMIDSLMRFNIGTIDRYLPGIMSILWNDVVAEDAVCMVEAAMA